MKQEEEKDEIRRRRRRRRRRERWDQKNRRKLLNDAYLLYAIWDAPIAFNVYDLSTEEDYSTIIFNVSSMIPHKIKLWRMGKHCKETDIWMEE